MHNLTKAQLEINQMAASYLRGFMAARQSRYTTPTEEYVAETWPLLVVSAVLEGWEAERRGDLKGLEIISGAWPMLLPSRDLRTLSSQY